MAEIEDKESRTEEASEKKKADALEKGNVPFSREATLFASLSGVLVALVFFTAAPARDLASALSRLLDEPGAYRLERGTDAIDLLTAFLAPAAGFLMPIVLILGLSGMVAAAVQNTPSLILNRIAPQWSRVSPMAGLKRLIGSQGRVEFGKALFKLVAIAFIAGLVLYSQQRAVVNAIFTDPHLLPEVILQLAIRLVATVCIGTIVLVAADLVWSRVFWKNELRMSHQEVKEELKQAEGDPLVKARLRSLARQRSRQRMMNQVPGATVVIANPTHYAIALKYDRQKGGAPLVLAKGTDLVALKIREIAERSAVPVVEDRALARALYQAVEVNQWIPPEFYRPVAQVLQYIYTKRQHAP